MAKILYVDDEPDIREIATLSLGLNSDFDVRIAEGGAEALEIAIEWLPDIILLDVMMPDMDGPMTRAELQKNPATQNIPVVFITARTQSSEIERFNTMDVRGIIAKPFDPMSLATQVASFLES